jgi:hypothetical protein
MVDKINKTKSLGWPELRWIDVVIKYLLIIKTDSVSEIDKEKIWVQRWSRIDRQADKEEEMKIYKSKTPHKYFLCMHLYLNLHKYTHTYIYIYIYIYICIYRSHIVKSGNLLNAYVKKYMRMSFVRCSMKIQCV